MSASLIKLLEKAQKRRSGGKKKARKTSKARRKPRAPKIVFRTRTKTVVKRVIVHRAAKHAAPRHKKAKKRSAKKHGGKGPKPGSRAWVAKMALARKKAARKR